MELLITIDTEEDDAWSGHPEITTENVAFLPRFQLLCDRYGFPPTYLANGPVAADPRLADLLGPAVKAGRAEVGVHLHPWSSEPLPESAPGDRAVRVYPHEIPIELFREKTARIVQRIQRCFGVEPISHRAGRWGFAPPQIPVLLDLGIRVDCSVTPHVTWARYRGALEGNGGPDFRGSPPTPYWLDLADVRRPGVSGLLELPMTVLYPRGLLARSPWAWGAVDRSRGGAWGPLLRRLGVAPLMFRPWPGVSVSDLLAMARLAERLGLPYLMMMFHSSELMPGGSPYFPDAAAVERLYGLLEAVFSGLRKAGVRGSTVGAFASPYLRGEREARGQGATYSARIKGLR